MASKYCLLFSFLFFLFLSGFCQDSLMYFEGKKIPTATGWQNNRREELKKLVLENIYGMMPGAPEWDSKIIKEVLLKEKNILYKEVAIQLYKDHLPTRTIRLSIFIPANHTHPVPVVVAINKCGNPTVSSIAEVGVYHDRILHPLCKKEMKKRGGTVESLRGLQNDYWAIDTLMNRGYAFATFHDSDVGADTNSLEQGIFPFYPELKTDTGWRLIAAWAWGLQRAVDYLATDKQIDSSRVILFGHSRRGKAALLAAALDERVAMVVPHQSGTGGMALGKKHPMESLKQITKTFPFWFSNRFRAYAQKPKSLPLDQHYLLALMAPRPVIETVGTLDIWSSFWLSLKTMRLVSPVYQLYGKQGLRGSGKVCKRDFLKTGMTGEMVQVRRPYTHTMNADYWNLILDFANQKLPSPLKNFQPVN